MGRRRPKRISWEEFIRIKKNDREVGGGKECSFRYLGYQAQDM